MAGKYITILESEFDNIFKSDKNWVKEYSGNAMEIVYTKNMIKKPHIQINVFSSIHKDSGLSRTVGKDAIRVTAINTETQRGIMKTGRINRVPNWETRLIKKVEDVWNYLK